MIDLIFQILAGFVILGTVMPFFKSDYWLVRGWDFPRIQLFFIGLLAVLGLSLTGFDGADNKLNVVFLIILVAAILSLLSWIFPYTRFFPKEVMDGKGEEEISFLVSNVLMSNRKSEALIALIKDLKPDLFIALETDQWWIDQLSEMKTDYPHAVELPQDDTYGMVVRSRIALDDLEVEYFVRENIPSVHANLRLGNKAVVHLHTVHPKPPFPDEHTDTTSTDRDAELLIVGQRVEKTGGPTIVLGDLNDVAWSRTTRLFQKTSNLLDPRKGRGLFNTFHAGHWFLRWPLDHIFISDHFRVRCIERLPSIGSDHFPFYARFSYEPQGTEEQEAPEKDAEDEAEAGEKIEAAENKNQPLEESLKTLPTSSA